MAALLALGGAAPAAAAEPDPCLRPPPMRAEVGSGNEASAPPRSATPAAPAEPKHVKLIWGYVRDASGPIANAQIEFLDDDLNRDDFMGSTTTDGSGYYRFEFRKARWDMTVPGATAWRPDIYIRVRWNGGFEHRTGTRDNLRMRDMRRDYGGMQWDIGLPRVEADTTFRASAHGLHFANSFEVNILGRLTHGFGLCGGMARYVLDKFHAQVPVPPDLVPPKKGALFDTLYKLQRDSLLPLGWAKVMAWQVLPDEDFKPAGVTLLRGLGFRTKKQWARLKELLDAGRPAVLTLIRERGVAAPTNNHQVLAYAYRMLPSSRVELRVYDPNEPHHDEVYVHFHLDDEDRHAIRGHQEIRGTHGTLPMRGFYVVAAYENAPALDGLGVSQQAQSQQGALHGESRTWAGDFDGNGLADHLQFQAAAATWVLRASDGQALHSTFSAATNRGYESMASWVGRFDNPSRDSVLFYNEEDHRWTLVGLPGSASLQEAAVGETSGFGYLTAGHEFVSGDFDGDGLDELVFHFPADRNWWLGQVEGGVLQWRRIAITPSLHWHGDEVMEAADLRGAGSEQILVYSAGSRSWYLGWLDPRGSLFFSILVGNTASFGALDDDDVRLVGDFDGDGRSELFLRVSATSSCHLGELVDNQLLWVQLDLAPGVDNVIDHDEDQFLVGNFVDDGIDSQRVEVAILGPGQLRVWALEAAVLRQFSGLPQPKVGREYLVDVGRFRAGPVDSILAQDVVTGRLDLGSLAQGHVTWERRFEPRLGVVENDYGGCGVAGRRPYLRLTGEPRIGQSMTYDVIPDSLQQPGLAVALVGLQKFAREAAPNCWLMNSMDMVVPLDESMRFHLPIRLDPAIVGLGLHVQAALVDPQAPLGLTLTSGQSIYLGDGTVPEIQFIATLSDIDTGSSRYTRSLRVALRVEGVSRFDAVRRLQYSNDAGRTWSPWIETSGETTIDLDQHGGSNSPGLKTVHLRVIDRLQREHILFLGAGRHPTTHYQPSIHYQ